MKVNHWNWTIDDKLMKILIFSCSNIKSKKQRHTPLCTVSYRPPGLLLLMVKYKYDIPNNTDRVRLWHLVTPSVTLMTNLWLVLSPISANVTFSIIPLRWPFQKVNFSLHILVLYNVIRYIWLHICYYQALPIEFWHLLKLM